MWLGLVLRILGFVVVLPFLAVPGLCRSLCVTHDVHRLHAWTRS